MGRKFRDYMAQVEAERTVDDQELREAFRAHHRRAAQIRELRKQRGLTQVQLAELSGIAQPEISRIEQPGGNPTEDTLVRVAAALGARWELTADSDTSSYPVNPPSQAAPA